MDGVDPVYLAISRFRRRKFESSIDICTRLLDRNPFDQAVWYVKCRSLTAKNWIDDIDMEEEGVAELLLDENSVAQAPRPGTSLKRPLTGAAGSGSGGSSQAVRPMTKSGRPLTGFSRPGTQSSGGGGSSVEGAFEGARPGTSRPVTQSGRFVRLGTASLRSEPGGPFINSDKLDLRKYAARPALAKALCDYLLYCEHNPKKALELSSLATVECDYKDWWWKARLGKCYYQLGLLRDSEKQFKSAIKTQDMVICYMELCKVYLKLDQPNTALEWYQRGVERHAGDTHLLLGIARIHDQLNDIEKGVAHYKRVLALDPVNVESIACLASNHFYEDQPEIALRYFRRLLQMGVNSTELWCNIGLCCFYASQYDMTLNCFEQALALASDDNMADVWYNIGQVAIGIGDLGLAYQAFKVAISVDPNHAESFNNLGVLELRKGNIDQAKTNFQTATRLAPHQHESTFNEGLLCFKLGDFQESFQLASKAMKVYPTHSESMDLLRQLRLHFAAL